MMMKACSCHNFEATSLLLSLAVTTIVTISCVKFYLDKGSSLLSTAYLLT